VSDELDVLLRLVSEGRLSAEDAAPIVAALQDKSRLDGRTSTDDKRRVGSAQEALSGRKLRIFVAENGHAVVDMSIPLGAAGFAIDQVPGLSPDHRNRIVEAIQSGRTGPILEVSDHGDEVRLTIE
jgi:ribosomal protein S18 acetylase RimI-like enzyme